MVKRYEDDGLVDLVKPEWSWGSRGSEVEVRRWRSE
jgi:hypothetical protein